MYYKIIKDLLFSCLYLLVLFLSYNHKPIKLNYKLNASYIFLLTGSFLVFYQFLFVSLTQEPPFIATLRVFSNSTGCFVFSVFSKIKFCKI